MTQTPELKPCPFCGGTAAIVGFAAPERWVVCATCGGQSSTRQTEIGAAESWNRRADLAPASTVSDAVKVLLDDSEAIGRLAMAGSASGTWGIQEVLRALANQEQTDG